MCDAFPSDLIKDIPIMSIKPNSKAANIVTYALNYLKKEETKRIIFHGELETSEKVATHVEILKREFLPAPLYQWNRIDGKVDEATKKRIPYLEILLSKEPFEVKIDGQQCSTDEKCGATLPAPKKTVPPMPVKRIQYGGSDGKEVSKENGIDQNGFADKLLPIIRPRETVCQPPKKFKRKCDEEENAFARPRKRQHNKSKEKQEN